MKTPTNFWGIQAVISSKEKALSFRHTDGQLYFTTDKRKGIAPPPALFSTKKDAEKALDKQKPASSDKDKRKLKRMFTNVIEHKYAEPVKVNISFN